jgi:hypothetical protein
VSSHAMPRSRSVNARDPYRLSIEYAPSARSLDPTRVSGYRNLGLDKDSDAHLEAAEAAVEVTRGR